MKLFAFVMAAALSAGAATLPHAEGELLSGAKVTIPEVFAGRRVVVIVGFSKASSNATGLWREKLTKEFPGARVYECAVLESAPSLVRGMIIRSIRKGTPQERLDKFIALVRGEKGLKESLGFGPGDDAYVAALDERGEIVWHSHGASPEGRLSGLKEALR